VGKQGEVHSRDGRLNRQILEGGSKWSKLAKLVKKHKVTLFT
jgi:hypothetical protein